MTLNSNPLTLDFKIYLTHRYAPSTVKTITRDVANYTSQCPQAATASHKEVLSYLGQLRLRYPSPGTVKSILCSVKAWYNFLIFTGKRSDNPAASIRLRDKINQDIQHQDLFTAAELEALVNNAMAGSPLLAIRNKVMLSLLVYQALRPRELAALLAEDTDLEQAILYIRASAETSSRSLPLKPHQILLFHQYQTQIRPDLLQTRQTSAYLVTARGTPLRAEDITGQVHQTFKTAYPPRKVNCRTIRQSVITNLLKEGHNLRVVQTLAGHKSPGSTQKYQTSDLEELRKDIRELHPMSELKALNAELTTEN